MPIRYNRDDGTLTLPNGETIPVRRVTFTIARNEQPRVRYQREDNGQHCVFVGENLQVLQRGGEIHGTIDWGSSTYTLDPPVVQGNVVASDLSGFSFESDVMAKPKDSKYNKIPLKKIPTKKRKA